MNFPSLAFVGLAVALAAAACSSDELFSSGGTTTPTGTGASTSTTASGGGGASTTTSTTVTNGGSGGGGVTTTSTSIGGAGGTGGAPAEIPCSNQTCYWPQICCLSYYGPQYDECGAPGGCQNGIEIECNAPSDCEQGWVCCGRWTQNGYTDVACSLTCEDDASSMGVLLCDTQGDCPFGLCTPSGSLPQGFSYCAL